MTEREASNFVILLDYFGYSGSLRFHISSDVAFSYFCKKCHWDFDRDCMNLVDCFLLWPFYQRCLPILEHMASSFLFCGFYGSHLSHLPKFIHKYLCFLVILHD